MAIRRNLLASTAPQTVRKTRSPKHQFNLVTRPYQIQPFMIAPVLPGETLKSGSLQARVVSDPLKDPLIGWWAEYYFFYVKHRDLDDRDKLVDMMLQPNYDTSVLNTAGASLKTYHYANSIDWVAKCMQRIVSEYFRDEDETYTGTGAALLDGLPLAAAVNIPGHNTFTQSFMSDASMPTGDEVDAGDLPIDAAKLEAMLSQYEFLRGMEMTNMSYEEWLATFGVKQAGKLDPHRPELLRYIRSWTYPTNTVEPTTGTPSSACSWSIAETLDKDRFFKEPGFIVGVTVKRPKVYLANQIGAGVHMLDDAISWLPAMMREHAYTSLKQYADNTGPVLAAGVDAGYWLDVRDLFMYGDQFLNYAITGSAKHQVGLPKLAAGVANKKYAAGDVIDAMFAGASPANTIREDGVVALSILGAQETATDVTTA